MCPIRFQTEMLSNNSADPLRRDALARLGVEDDEPVGDLLQAHRRPAFREPELPDDGQNLNCSLALAGLNRMTHKRGQGRPAHDASRRDVTAGLSWRS